MLRSLDDLASIFLGSGVNEVMMPFFEVGDEFYSSFLADAGRLDGFVAN